MRNNSKGLILIGLLLIAAAFFLVAYNFYSDRQAKEAVKDVVDLMEDLLPEKEETTNSKTPETSAHYEEIEIPNYILNPEMDMPVETIDGNDYIGVLEFPSLELKLPIISEWSYPRLKIAPCRYEGSAYTNDLIISGHNYTSHFGKLQNLSAGDIVIFTDIEGNEFIYEVVELEILKPTSIEEMKSGDWALSLFTCTLSGQTRLTVRCELVDE
ncbi:MAG TPA: sortase [Clostridiales bacterium]|nr:sortase [Clostridiales bacterium]